mmetsp:Transcript_43080/g.119147  ORF Transcript_43080/g.119147 Transcript_43080/m.119147 type:complete len:154 (+) Transcript_43080:125-586(+)
MFRAALHLHRVYLCRSHRLLSECVLWQSLAATQAMAHLYTNASRAGLMVWLCWRTRIQGNNILSQDPSLPRKRHRAKYTMQQRQSSFRRSWKTKGTMCSFSRTDKPAPARPTQFSALNNHGRTYATQIAAFFHARLLQYSTACRLVVPQPRSY